MIRLHDGVGCLTGFLVLAHGPYLLVGGYWVTAQ
jgi:hypothetical protein